MGKKYDSLDQQLTEFIQRQRMFFVATAPNDGHINLSPKGLDSFRIFDERTVGYADLVGSGIETVAHLKQNGRIVLMFCSFEGAPTILRIHGCGEVIEPAHSEFLDLQSLFPPLPGLRSIIRITCERITDSCGFGVPLYQYQGQRTQLLKWCEQQGTDGLVQYQRSKNARSIDDLPGLE